MLQNRKYSSRSRKLNFTHRSKYKIFNSVDRDERHQRLLNSRDISDFIPISTITECVAKLPVGKAVGADGVPAEVLRHSSLRLRAMLSLFINSCLRHCFLPELLMRLTLIPLIKNKLKPSTDSENYRMIAIASSFSKLFEFILSSKCKPALHTTDN